MSDHIRDRLCKYLGVKTTPRESINNLLDKVRCAMFGSERDPECYQKAVDFVTRAVTDKLRQMGY